MPEPVFPLKELQGNRFIAEQLSFNAEELREEAESEIKSLNVEQLHTYVKVMESCDNEEGRLFFIDGPGGTGKNYFENLLLKSVRGRGKIALAFASSGIAALLL